MNFLYENETINSKKNPLLVEKILQNSSLHPYFEPNFKGIRPKNICGFLSIGDESHFIVPKIVPGCDEENLRIFIYMLLYAYDIQLKNEEIQTALNEKHRIFELFIRLFADALLLELKRGVFKRYVTMQENLKVLRGKYLFEKNFANFHHQNLYCEFDEFSMDNDLNRFFLYAIRYFKRFSNYPNLHRCEAILDEVEFFNVDLRRLNIRFDRLNSRYRKSYEVARMILQKLVPMPEGGQERSFAFLFDMAEVFEKFVGRLFQEIEPSTRLQVSQNFGDLQLRPDIVMDGLIVDTKYKSVKGREDLLAQDKYQIFAYGINFKCRNVMLLYPKHLVDVAGDLVLGSNDNEVYLIVQTLELNQNYENYEEFIYNTIMIIQRIINGEK